MPIRTVALMVGGSQDFLKPRIARTFFFRYHYCGVPKHMEYLEEARHHMSCAPAEPIFSRNWIEYFRGFSEVRSQIFQEKSTWKLHYVISKKKCPVMCRFFQKANRLGPRLSVVPVVPEVFPGPAEGRKEGQPRYQEIVRSLSEPWSGLDQPRLAFDFRSKSLRSSIGAEIFCVWTAHIFRESIERSRDLDPFYLYHLAGHSLVFLGNILWGSWRMRKPGMTTTSLMQPRYLCLCGTSVRFQHETSKHVVQRHHYLHLSKDYII